MSSKKTTTREPIHLERMHEGFDADAFANKVATKFADLVMEDLKADRKRKGLPPLPK
jgi:hypothetical protein